jgi:hypothetical protein
MNFNPFGFDQNVIARQNARLRSAIVPLTDDVANHWSEPYRRYCASKQEAALMASHSLTMGSSLDAPKRGAL